jgi:hypothetical protein
LLLLNLHARVAHLFDGAGDVAAVQFDAAAAFGEQAGLVAVGGGVEGGELNAVVGRQAQDVDLGESPMASP